jgi:hypothetical protein
VALKIIGWPGEASLVTLAEEARDVLESDGSGSVAEIGSALDRVLAYVETGASRRKTADRMVYK